MFGASSELANGTSVMEFGFNCLSALAVICNVGALPPVLMSLRLLEDGAREVGYFLPREVQ